MTDKIGSDGSPSGVGCTDPNGTCFSVYYSCTKPFRIAGSSSAVKRSDYQCPYDSGSGPEDWPKVWIGDDGESVDASEPGVYRRESSIWNANDFTLETAPLRYRQDVGGLCGNNLNDGEHDNDGTPKPSREAPSPQPNQMNAEGNDIITEKPISSPTTDLLLSSSPSSNLQSIGLSYLFVSSAFFAIFACAF